MDLLFELRTRGKIVSLSMGATIYELDGRFYRYHYVRDEDRREGEGPWRAEECEAPPGS